MIGKEVHGAPREAQPTVRCASTNMHSKHINLPPILPILYEARGFLLRVTKSDGFTVAEFEFGQIALPLELFNRLEPLVRRKVAILRIDSDDYRTRAV